MTSITLQKRLDGMKSIGMEEYVDEREIIDLLEWIDRVPLSIPRKDLHKDFSDGGKVSEYI